MKMTPTQDVEVSYGLFEESNTVWREDAGSLFSCKWRLVFYVMQMVEVLWASVGCAVLNVHAKFKCLYPLYTYITHIFWLGKILEKIGLSVGLFICQGLDCLCGLEGLEGMEGMEVFHPAMISVHVSENIFIFSTVSQNA